MPSIQENPRLRTDLRIQEHSGPEGNSFVVKDPLAERFFQIGEAEYFIARQLDGETGLETIRERAEKEFGGTIEEATLRQFIERLEQMGLVEGPESARQAGRERHGRLRGSVLYLRLGAWDPDRLFNRLIPKLGFFFTPQFVALSAVVIAAAVAIATSSWPEVRHDLISLLHFRAFLLAWMTLLLITALHEVAHGMTCKHFGGEVHEIGFLLLYFQRALYCNVSDAWMFPEKSRRLWVTFAGAYFEFFLWGLATLAWRATESGIWIHSLALLVMVTTGINILFNFLPLIKLDGYYLLSDYLEVPNLRQRSFGYLKDVFRRRILRMPGEDLPVSRREQRIFLVYGLLAATYSYWLLSIVALQFGRYLVARYHALGLAIFLAALGLIMKNPLKRFVTNPGAVLAPVFKLGSGPERRWKVLGCLAGLAAVFFLLPVPFNVGGDFKILPTWNADICAQVEGEVRKIDVQEGARVRRGQTLGGISDRDYRSELQKVRDAISQQQARLAELVKGARPEDIALAERNLETAQTREQYAQARYQEADQIQAAALARARSAVAEAQDRLRYARLDLARYQALYRDGLISKQRLDEASEKVDVGGKALDQKQSELRMLSSDQLTQARSDLAVGEKQQAEARAQLAKLLAGTRPEQIAAARAALDGLKTQEQFLESQIRLCTLVSPVDGVVATHRPQEKIGTYVHKGDLVLKVDELQTVAAEITVPESDVADVHVGQPVRLKARAFPSRTFTGKVAAIAPVASSDPALPGKQFLVTTTLDNDALLLKGEMTGNGKIAVGRRTLAQLFGRKLAQTFRVEFWSWW